jgi:hypothetical protein
MAIIVMFENMKIASGQIGKEQIPPIPESAS